MKVLLQYYIKRHTYITIEDVYENLSGYVAKQKVLRANKKLLLNGMITKHIDWERKQMTISAEGVHTATQIVNQVLKLNF